MGGVTLSTRLCAIWVGAALLCAQLLCAIHEAEALGHKPGQVCDLCLSLAKVDHALFDVPAPLPVHGRPAVHHRPAARALLTALVRDLHARSPPFIEAASSRLIA